MELGSNSLTSSSSSSPRYKSSAAGAVDTKLELTTESPASAVEKEHMFDKVVTPSDVGKLNRLVIPKQHAEKYFPLDSSSNEKGLLLNFEDRTGKQWRFRYSYWNSSQSYVMTKGWSRFVKEKKLDAGDAVSFHRGSAPSDRHLLFIDWRRRPDAPETFLHAPPPPLGGFSFAGRWMRAPPPPPPVLGHMQYLPPPPHHHLYHQSYPYTNGYIGGLGNSFPFGGHFSNVPSNANQVFYLRSPAEQSQAAAVLPRGGGGVESMVFDSVPVGHHGKAASGKRLRLFGVNMECPASENSSNEEDSYEINNNNNSQAHNPLQLRLYNGTPIAGISAVDCLDKGKSSVTTFNFDI